MDSFRLLTKGTSLAKSGLAPLQPVLPSSGPSKTPVILDETIVTGQDAVSNRGKKRKRLASVQGDADDSVMKSNDSKIQALKIGATSAVDIDPVFESRTVDECKQILRRHKLKVTLMTTPSSKVKKSKDIKSTLTQIYPQPLAGFAELRQRFKISKRLGENLAEQGYSTPTEVQLGAIPLLLGDDEDRGLSQLSKKMSTTKSTLDLMTIAPTGSGKTLAFLIPVIQGLLNSKHQRTESGDYRDAGPYIKAIILAPTHELADQIVNEARKMIKGTGLRVAGMRKGMNILPGDTADEDKTDGPEAMIKAEILVSTPLALVNAAVDKDSKPRPISSVEYLVLDEADVLLDPLFREQSLSIWKSCSNPILQVSLWSATIGASIEHLAQEVITSRRSDLGLSKKGHHIIRLIAGLKDSSLPTISHRLIYAATEQGKLLAIRQIMHPNTASVSAPALRPPFLIFTQTIPRASALHSELLYDIPLEAGGSTRIAVLHSSLSDTARSDIMARFRKGEIWVLITTDLLSRGVDFRGVNGIVNYDIPTTSAAYVHRAGRTGRAGREGGVAITLYTKEDIPYIKNVANVVAASERVHGKKSSSTNPTLRGEGVPSWLLDALPDVSKKTKKELKHRGVKERRAGVEDSKVRISTKSGHHRKEEHRRKGAVEASRKRKQVESNDPAGAGNGAASDSEWGGIED